MFLLAFLKLQFFQFPFLMQNEYRYHWKIYLHSNFIWIIFQEGWNMPNLENQYILHFELQSQKLLRLYHDTYILLFCINFSTKQCQGFWFNRTHLPLFENMSVKIYTNFFSSSGGYNFKFNHLKDGRCKPDVIMPLNVFWSILWKETVS